MSRRIVTAPFANKQCPYVVTKAGDTRLSYSRRRTQRCRRCASTPAPWWQVRGSYSLTPRVRCYNFVPTLNFLPIREDDVHAHARAGVSRRGSAMGMRTIVVALMTVLLLWGTQTQAATDQKGTLVVALDTLGAQTMDPILEARAPHAHYQAPVYDCIVWFDPVKGGIGPGAAERWATPLPASRSARSPGWR